MLFPLEMYGSEDGSVPATFQILYMIGWKPHESQVLCISFAILFWIKAKRFWLCCLVFTGKTSKEGLSECLVWRFVKIRLNSDQIPKIWCQIFRRKDAFIPQISPSCLDLLYWNVQDYTEMLYQRNVYFKCHYSKIWCYTVCYFLKKKQISKRFTP